jgi:hypothetical protein
MNERRAEQRFMCSELVTVELENQGQAVVANLEDISPSGACLEMQQAVPLDAKMVLHCPGCRFHGKVRYCVFHQTGYQVGVELMECKWSKENYEPEHLLGAPLIQSCPGADIPLFIEPESPLCDRVRVVARAVAWTCERLSPEDFKQCFSRWFQLPPKCSLCDEFVLAYQDEYAALSSQPANEKRRAAGGQFDDV